MLDERLIGAMVEMNSLFRAIDSDVLFFALPDLYSEEDFPIPLVQVQQGNFYVTLEEFSPEEGRAVVTFGDSMWLHNRCLKLLDTGHQLIDIDQLNKMIDG